jgi:ketosteroid isomerase-like protein
MLDQQWGGVLLILCAVGLSGCKRGDTGEPSGGKTAEASGGPSTALTASDRDSIRAYVARFDQTILAQDWPAAVAFYSEDAVLLPPGGPEVQGRAAIRKFFEGFPKFAVFKQQVEEIQGDDSLAYPEGSFETSMVLPGGKTPIKNKGKVLGVWRKQANGSWVVTRVIWNSDLPPGKGQ